MKVRGKDGSEGPVAGTALTVLEPAGEVADLAVMADHAADYAQRSISERTRKEYDRCWRRFACEAPPARDSGIARVMMA